MVSEKTPLLPVFTKAVIKDVNPFTNDDDSPLEIKESSLCENTKETLSVSLAAITILLGIIVLFRHGTSVFVEFFVVLAIIGSLTTACQQQKITELDSMSETIARMSSETSVLRDEVKSLNDDITRFQGVQEK